jgi:hypothetical protein
MLTAMESELERTMREALLRLADENEQLRIERDKALEDALEMQKLYTRSLRDRDAARDAAAWRQCLPPEGDVEAKDAPPSYAASVTHHEELQEVEIRFSHHDKRFACFLRDLPALHLRLMAERNGLAAELAKIKGAG